MLGLGSQAVCILIHLNTAVGNCNIVVPTVQDLSESETTQDISNIPVPGENDIVSFEGSAILILGPILINAILMSNTKDPFKLIPLMTRIAKEFDIAQTENNAILQGNAINHSDNLNAWLYSMKVGSINEDTLSLQMTSKFQCFVTTLSVHYINHNNDKCSRSSNSKKRLGDKPTHQHDLNPKQRSDGVRN
jgi:hypothetical protein